MKSFVNVLVLAGVLAFAATCFAETYTGEASNRLKVNLGATPWKLIKSDAAGVQGATYNDAGAVDVGIPHCFAEDQTFVNNTSGGGNLPGGPYWYRKKLAIPASQANKKVFLEFEGAHTGIQVYVNGTLCTNAASALNAQATHVIGFMGFTVDITSMVKFDGTDNIIAARVAMNSNFFESPSFAGVFRFGQGSGGIFRPVWLHITDKVYVPSNEYSGAGEWGTYVAATNVAADGSSATVRLLTNVRNAGTGAASVTLTTKIADAITGNVVYSGDATKSIAAGAISQFDQTATIANPKLWYPNNSSFGKPNMHKVYHIVKVGGTVVDVFVSPLGIRTITWDKDYPYINGHKHVLYGAASRYDYPALGTALSPEIEWRDIKMIADIGGNLWRPGHSASSLGVVDACDAYGVMLVQPSGEGEGAFSTGANATANNKTLKQEMHRDGIIRDRNHPSILSWEVSNGDIDPTYLETLRVIGKAYDSLAPKALAVRGSPWVAGTNDLHGCTLTGCDAQQKPFHPDWPWWGSEYWGRRNARYTYDQEIAFSGEYLRDWASGVKNKCFGMVQWYLAEEPGECGEFLDGTPANSARSFGCSLADCNRIPKFLYYQYGVCWVKYKTQPRVALSNTWNRSGTVRVVAFSNCPKVRLSVNGVSQGEKTPNDSAGLNGMSDVSNASTQLPFECVWDGIAWQSGTVKAEGLDASGAVVCSDQKVTAGTPHHIVLTKDAPVVKPDGSAFTITANGTDAALILATVVDDKGVWCPNATGLITWTVSGPATYRGGSDQVVTTGKPYGYHAPGDPELAIEGGMAKVAVRSQFTTGTVTVGATVTGLTLAQPAASITYQITPVVDQIAVGVMPGIGGKVMNASPVTNAVMAGSTLKYRLSGRANVSMEIVNADGKIVNKMSAANQPAGWHSVSISKKTVTMGAGVYFVRLSVDGTQQYLKKVTLVK